MQDIHTSITINTIITVDFETVGIDKRPAYPPAPVGVSIKVGAKPSKYYGFGHPTGNNCGIGEPRGILLSYAAQGLEFLFQNGKFDVDVGQTFGFFPADLPWYRIHDTMFLLFLDSPHEINLDLKSSAERILGIPPTERDLVKEWLLENQPLLRNGIAIVAGKNNEHYWARYICEAPARLVGPYCIADTDRTYDLFCVLYPSILDRGMLHAYNVERELMPILMTMERNGLPLDMKALGADIAIYSDTLSNIDHYIKTRIDAPEWINLDSAAEMLEALDRVGLVDTWKMPRTATGKVSTAKNSLLLGITDAALLGALQYRSALKVCLNTFMMPWHKMGVQSGGLIYTSWNQIKGDVITSASGHGGARTGRLSSNPNFQNMPKEFKQIFLEKDTDIDLPAAPIPLPPLPNVRKYLAAPEGKVFISCDYKQQEPRILAHFIEGELLEKYKENPLLDIHTDAQVELAKVGKIFTRKQVKNTNLGLIYGMGISGLMDTTGLDRTQAVDLKESILNLYTGIAKLQKTMLARAALNAPFRTWAGREYYCQPSEMKGGKKNTYEYKMVNLLIQGSAADCTKQAVINYYSSFEDKSEFSAVLILHDDIVALVPAPLDAAVTRLKTCMESVHFDVPMLVDTKVSYTNLAEFNDLTTPNAGEAQA